MRHAGFSEAQAKCLPPAGPGERPAGADLDELFGAAFGLQPRTRENRGADPKAQVNRFRGYTKKRRKKSSTDTVHLLTFKAIELIRPAALDSSCNATAGPISP